MPKTVMATTEARRALPTLVNEMAAKTKPSNTLLDDAVQIGRHRKRGAVLLPEIDAEAHAEEVARLRMQVVELEDELEDASLALYVQQRLTTTSGGRLTAAEFLADIGFEDQVGKLPRT